MSLDADTFQLAGPTEGNLRWRDRKVRETAPETSYNFYIYISLLGIFNKEHHIDINYINSLPNSIKQSIVNVTNIKAAFVVHPETRHVLKIFFPLKIILQER